MKNLLSACLLLLVFTAAAQVKIPLVPFTLQVPTVNEISVKPISEQRYDYLDMSTGEVVTPDSTVGNKAYFKGSVITKSEFQPIYYELHRADEQTGVRSNRVIKTFR